MLEFLASPAGGPAARAEEAVAAGLAFHCVPLRRSRRSIVAERRWKKYQSDACLEYFEASTEIEHLTVCGFDQMTHKNTLVTF